MCFRELRVSWAYFMTAAGTAVQPACSFLTAWYATEARSAARRRENELVEWDDEEVSGGQFDNTQLVLS